MRVNYRPVQAVLTLAMLAGAAMGQDSVSRNANGGNGLPGDSLAPWTASAARVSFVVDLAAFQGSWGTPFGAAPLMKASRISSARFNAANLSATISTSARTGASYPASTFARWTQAGGGLHTTENNTALNTILSPNGPVTLFGVAAMDVDEQLSGTTLYFANIAYGAQVAFDPALPTRLFVTRVIGAQNSSAPTQLDRSQFGVGSIDADGNLCIRADSFNSAGTTTSLLQGDNYFRVRLPSRSTSVNLIDNAGGGNSAAVDWVLQRDGATQAAPTAIPADLAGRSVLLGADFMGLMRAETSPLVVTNTAGHRPGTMDHRGSATFSSAIVFSGSVGTGAVLSRSTGGSGKADSISVFGLSSGGTVVAARTLTIPATIADTCDAFGWPMSGGGFRGYDSQTTFRGGVGPAAVGRDALGMGLAAAVLYQGATPNPANPYNAIAAARFDPTNPNSTAVWTAAAWVDSAALDGKDILGDYGSDGAPGSGDAGEGDGVVNGLDAPIGRLAALTETSLGYAGPSMSSPAFDAGGNIYFIASASLKRWTGAAVVNDFDLGVFRAVLDPATFCYKLELLFRVGQTFAGQNSARNYRVTGINLADSDSVSSAALWSGSVAGNAWNNVNPALLQPADPANLGGLVLTTRVVYDVNQDGLYEDPTQPGSNAASVDEGYNVVLYVGNITPPAPTCDPDVNCDGSVNGFDIEAMEQAVNGDMSNFCQADPDYNHDGAVNGFDVEAVEQGVNGAPCP
ncbi:hypothetical protein PHYC_00127 [Phycisphaerales bacterium]|nr:hypothetical protein PHYC_00127 [Phycisphaerales bacterium]